jgi:uncharacterized sodium:solute symporter family permease YidK
VRLTFLWSVFIVSLLVAAVTAGLTIWLLVAFGRTNGFENLVIVTLVIFGATFLAALGMAKRIGTAALVSALLTTGVVGGGFALLYAVYANLCGSSGS